jgi:predicted lipid-binding transport protein (Tim44 family)
MNSRLAGRLLLGMFGFAMVTLAWGPIAGLAALAALGLFVLALMKWAPKARQNRQSQGPRAR